MDNSPKETTKKPSKKAWFVLALIILCLILAEVFRPTFSMKLFPHVGVQESSLSEEEINELLREHATEYQSRNHQLLKDFEAKLKTLGQEHYQQARRNIAPFTREVTSFSFCGKMCAYLAWDKINGTTYMADSLGPLLSTYLYVPCGEAQAEILNALCDFIVQIQENDTQFRAGLMELSKENNFVLKDFASQDAFRSSIEKLSGEILSFALDKTMVAVGAGLEVIFIRSTIAAISKLATGVVSRLSATAASRTLIVADGPLPIGDIIVGGIAIGSLAWTSYDIYKISKKLPQELTNTTRELIDRCERETRQEALTRARAIVRLCDQGCKEFTKTIN